MIKKIKKIFDTKCEHDKRHDENGCEKLDPTPVSIPVGFVKPPSLQDQIRRLVKYQMSQEANARGQETFEEADDFEIGDDYDPKSPYEIQFEPEMPLERPKNGSVDRFSEEAPKDKGSASVDPGANRSDSEVLRK